VSLLVSETERLTLRPFVESDIDALYAIMGDAEAMQHTYIAKSREQCAERLHTYAGLESSLGYAPWTIVLRSTGTIIGWGGLSIDPFEPGWGSEVSYCLHPAHWGKGYATEVVQAALRLGFERFSLPVIVAFARAENIGSVRVLQKCGFVFLRYLPQMERNYYEIQCSAYRTVQSMPVEDV
jgi:[ribosomal protein S5]-alanine N-acetyltransferase